MKHQKNIVPATCMILLSTFLLLLFCAQWAAAAGDLDVQVPTTEEIERATNKLNISGMIETYAKKQNSYYTPLDALFGVRNGANYREDQRFRARLRLNFTYGLPTEEWFGLVQFDLDANDPDPEIEDGAAAGLDDNQSQNEFDMDSAFVMYRPFEVNGGRPFGIKLGVVPILATANAAYFHYFTGDIEEDFILYTAAALPEVPGVDIDFHISEDTGIGFAYANGVDDASEIGTLVRSDSTNNYVIWGEAKQWGFGWNGALQFVEGEYNPTEAHITPAGNTIYSYRHSTHHKIFNTLLSYRFDVGEIGLMPAIGYELIDGEQAAVPQPPLDWVRDVNVQNYQAGVNIFTRFFDIPGELSVLYTKTDTDNIEGVGILAPGTVNGAIDQALTANAGVPAGTWTAIAPPVVDEGKSKSILPVAGIDYDLHVEYGFDLTKSVQVGFFYHMLEPRTLSDVSTEYVRNQLSQGDTEATLAQVLGGGPVGAATADAFLNGVSEGVSDNLVQVKQAFEWTDTHTYGIFVKLLF